MHSTESRIICKVYTTLKLYIFSICNSIYFKLTTQQCKDMVNIRKKHFEWFSANRLTVHFSKTCYIIFKYKKQSKPDNYLAKINMNSIYNHRKVKSAKCLVVILNINLNWSGMQKHIYNTFSKEHGNSVELLIITEVI